MFTLQGSSSATLTPGQVLPALIGQDVVANSFTATAPDGQFLVKFSPTLANGFFQSSSSTVLGLEMAGTAVQRWSASSIDMAVPITSAVAAGIAGFTLTNVGAKINMGGTGTTIFVDPAAPTYITSTGDGFGATAFLRNDGGFDTGMVFSSAGFQLQKAGTVYATTTVGNALQFPRGFDTVSAAATIGGNLVAAGANGVLSNSGIFQAAAGAGVKLYGDLVDGAGSVNAFIDTAVAYSTAGSKLLSVRNNGVEKFFVDYAGVATAPIMSASAFQLNGVYSIIGSDLGSGDTTIRGNVTTGASVIAVPVCNASALTTAGAKIMAWFSDNLSTQVGSIDKDGSLFLNGHLGVGNSASASVIPVAGLVKKIEVFDAAGASLGFLPVYSSIV